VHDTGTFRKVWLKITTRKALEGKRCGSVALYGPGQASIEIRSGTYLTKKAGYW